MKSVFLFVCLIFYSSTSYTQDILGKWNGVLNLPGTQLRVVLNISSGNDEFEATLDSPDQGVQGIPVTKINFEGDNLKFSITNIGVEFEGVLGEDNVIVGTFKQRGQPVPLNLSRKEIVIKNVSRPQEPKKPYPYYIEDVTFENPQASITLSGTLTLPSENGKFPTVILISGSGPQNRDEEVFGHKPFLVLADHLTRNGIGVLRFDDRGIGESTGDFKTATTPDFAEDVKSALDYLRSRSEVDQSNIGLVGHSEGGTIAALVASDSKELGFIVLLGGPAVPGFDILIEQNRLIRQAMGIEDSIIQAEIDLLKGGLEILLKEDDLQKVRLKVQKYLDEELDNNPELIPEDLNKEDFINASIEQYATPWFKYFITYDPALSLMKVKCPVLALIGEKDLQVPANINLAATERILKKAGNNDFKVKMLDNLNHLFQESDKGTPDEYRSIEQTFSPIALAEISKWILNQIE